MRIERISDTQIRFILTNEDLAERNIKISELSVGSDKAQRLFQEMMHQAMTECDFESANTPLMMEAVPLGEEGVMVMVTKLSDTAEIEKKLSLFPLVKTALRFKKADVIEPTEEAPEEDSVSVFSFDTLDMMAEAAARLAGQFEGVSRAYKMDGRFYLVLVNETEDGRTTDDLESVMHEYGQKHISSPISRQYISERGETLILEDAVAKLKRMVGH
jgi:adapter protein MecA 1/2